MESAPRCRQQVATPRCHPVSETAPTTAGKVLEPTAVDCGGRCAKLFRFLPDQVRRTGCTCLLNLPAATTSATRLPACLFHRKGAAPTVPEPESSGRIHSGSHLIDRHRRAPRTAPGSTQSEGENPVLRGHLGRGDSAASSVVQLQCNRSPTMRHNFPSCRYALPPPALLYRFPEVSQQPLLSHLLTTGGGLFCACSRMVRSRCAAASASKPQSHPIAMAWCLARRPCFASSTHCSCFLLS